ncbi:MAG: hypothetical protein E7310_01080 [Clostridiales bacterium]|nr:hypothetical protein [Clostridiales bacterium]
MLSKFLNSKNGKIMNRALAFMLVFTLTFANYMLIGMYIAESSISYAKEEKEINLELKQGFKTNKVYEFEEGFKRIVQLEIASKIENAEGKAEIVIPETVIENKKAEKIKVNSYDTQFNFENNKLSFEAKKENSFTVTYTYKEKADYNEDEEKYEFDEPKLKSKEILVSVEVEDNKNIKSKAEEIEYVAGIQFGDIITVNETITDIYKGNMYLKENTEYSKKVIVDVKDIEKKLLKENFVIRNKDKILQENIDEETQEIISEEIENSIYYKSTTFSKKELLNIFGENNESVIFVTAKTNEGEKETVILFTEYDEKNEKYKNYEVIDVTKMNEEDDKIVIEHSEDVIDVIIKTNIPEKEGIFNIEYNKIIKLNEFVDIEKINKLESAINFSCKEDSYKVDLLNDYEIKEPETQADLSMEYVNANQTVLSSLINNEVNFTVDLLANGPEHKLYKNPIIKISLPSAVKVKSINDVALALDDGLKIANSGVINNTIIIEVVGEQEKYNYDEMQQSISLKALLEVERTTPTGEFEVTATCKNGEDDETNIEAIKVNVYSPAELISVTNLTVNGQVATSIEENNTIKINTFDQSTVANVDITLINNHGAPLKDLKLQGNLCDKETTINSSLIEAIKVSGLECEVEYFNGEEKVEEISLAKTYVISINEMKHGEQLNLSYTLSIPENLPYNEVLETSLEMDYIYNGNNMNKNLNMKITTGKGPSAKVEIVPDVENKTLNGGQIVTYNMKIINDGDEDIPEAVFTYEAIENGKIIEYTALQGSIFEYVEDEDNKKEWNIKDLAIGQEVEAEIVIKLDNVKKETQFLSKTTLVAGEKTIALEERNSKVVPADFEIKMTTYMNNQGVLSQGDTNKYRISIKNISNEEIQNAVVTTQIPKHTKFSKAYFYNENTDGIEEKNCNVNKDIVTYNIERIAKNEEIVVVLEVEVEELAEELNNEAEIKNYALVNAKGKKECQSNTITNIIRTAEFEIHLSSKNNVNLNEYDSVEYDIEVTNIGKRSGSVQVEDYVPEEISINKISYYTNKDDIKTKYTSNSEVELVYPLKEGQTINIKVEGVVKELKDSNTSKTINNVAKLNLGNGTYEESEVVTNIITKNVQENLAEKNDNKDNSNKEADSNEEKNSVNTYSILGVAWLDENEDGKRESTEKTLEGIEVLLVDATTGKVIENSDGKKLTTKTSKVGAYTFEGIKNGDYKVLFKYDTSKYHTTEYNKQGINISVNSDATTQKVTINGETQTVALTDTIKIKDSSVVNIDLGLKENDSFDLSLKKQIKKVTVKNSSGTTEYDFTNTNFAKIEIPGKNYKGSTLLIEYEITIANEGDVPAYITDILDYMPKDLTFNSEMNTNWYADSQGVLHDIALSMEELKPGKEVTETIVLTKTINSDSSLTIKNIAEIGSATNTEGLEEKDSAPANKKDGEDDIGQAELIVSIKTGGTWMYIGIVLINLIIISAGILLINKKVLKGNI